MNLVRSCFTPDRERRTGAENTAGDVALSATTEREAKIQGRRRSLVKSRLIEGIETGISIRHRKCAEHVHVSS